MRFAIVLLPMLLSCRGPQSYGGVNCDSLQVPVRVGDLPLGPPVPAPANLFRANPVLAATEDIKCCVATYWTGPPQDPDSCAAIDCEVVRRSVAVSHLGGQFDDEPCGFDGHASCNVMLRGDVVVGVTAYCFDY